MGDRDALRLGLKDIILDEASMSDETGKVNIGNASETGLLFYCIEQMPDIHDGH
jgi:hypothetical protein